MSQFPRNSRRLVPAIGIAAARLIVGGAYAQTPDPPRATGWLKALPAEQQAEAIDRQIGLVFRGQATCIVMD